MRDDAKIKKKRERYKRKREDSGEKKKGRKTGRPGEVRVWLTKRDGKTGSLGGSIS